MSLYPNVAKNRDSEGSTGVTHALVVEHPFLSLFPDPDLCSGSYKPVAVPVPGASN